MLLKSDKIDYVLRAISPIVHGNGNEGTEQLIRRRSIFYQGQFIQLPCISGNAIRGILRRHAGAFLLDALGIDKLSTAQQYFIFSGGTLSSGEGKVETPLRVRIRELFPFLSLWGVSLGNQMLAGKLKFSFLDPICLETTGKQAPLISAYLETLEYPLLSAYDLTKSIEYSRTDDQRFADYDTTNTTMMRYAYETLVEGTLLSGSLRLENASEIEQAALFSTLAHFKEHPFIGGRSSIGHGEVELTLLDMDNDLTPYVSMMRDYLLAHKTSILRFLEGVA